MNCVPIPLLRLYSQLYFQTMSQVILGIKVSHYIRIIQDRFHPTKFRGIRQVFVGFAALVIVATVSLRISDEFDRSVGGSDCNTSLVVLHQKKR